MFLTLVLRAERKALALDLVEFAINAETLTLTLVSALVLILPLPLALLLMLALLLGLRLCLFEALRERLSYLCNLLAVNEQITALARHRDVRVRDVSTAVIGVDRSHRMASFQEFPNEPLCLSFEIALRDFSFRIG